MTISSTSPIMPIALIVDRSGSMSSIESDVKGGVRGFITKQKQENGEAPFTLVQFDDQYDVIYDYQNIQKVDEERFVKEYAPRGCTALLDAIGRTTLELSKKLDALPEQERPKKVFVAIFTDGQENSSKEFNIDRIKEMIKGKEAAGWEFLFMGATLDTIEVAKAMGFSAKKSVIYDTSNFGSCMESVCTQLRKARSSEEVGFSEEERQKLAQKKV